MSSDLLQQLAAAAGFADDTGKLLQPVKEEPRVLLVTTVDVGGGATERIEVRVGEQPEDVARAFCQRHDLPEAIIGPLAQHLEENLRKAAATRVGGDSGKFSEGLSTQLSGDGTSMGTFGQPQRTKSPTLPGQQGGQGQAPGTDSLGDVVPGVISGNASLATATKPQYSFGSGMDDRLYEQLSSKLLDESQAPSTRRGNWVSASEVLSGGGGSGPNSKRSSSGLSNHHSNGPYQYGKSNMSGPSPRDQGSVHMRLYATAQERAARLEERRRMANAEVVAALTQRRSTMSWISAEMMRGRGANGAYDNYGEMLYAEGVEQLMSRLKRAELERKAREARELDGVTFAPVITKKAWELKQRERNSCTSLGAVGGLASLDAAGAEDYEKWQRLHMRGMRKSTQERLEQLRLQREAAEVAECTFRPRINKNSDALMTERAETLKALNLTHHEQLYADAERRQAKMEELQRWYPDGVTFQPQVNKDPRALEYLRRSWDRQKQQPQNQNQGTGAGSASTTSGVPLTTASTQSGQVPAVVARLYAEAERKQAKLEAARQLYNGSIDPVTNKPLFQPETGRGPRGGLGHARSNRGGAHIGDYLYRSAQELAKKRAEAEEAERRAAEEQSARCHTTAASQRMFTDLKLKRFRQIFEYLDEEGTGSLDLLAKLGRAPPLDDPDGERLRHPRVDNLDSEVLEDVEVAADVWARANGLMLTKEEEQQLAMGSEDGSGDGGKGPGGSLHSSTDGRAAGAAADGAAPGSPRRVPHVAASGSGSFASSGCRGPLPCPCPPLSIEMFMSCMEEALRLQRCPRAYLVPSPPAKQAPTHTFRPAINARSRALAAKTRPDTASTFELLHRYAAKMAERLEILRRKREEQGLEGCTFQPQLNTNRLNATGRTGGRSSGSRPASMDPSAFALAAAGIAAAAAGTDGSPSGGPGQGAGLQQHSHQGSTSMEADRRSLQQQLQELRLAADTAMDIQTQLMAQVAEDEVEAEGVRGDLEKFSMLEKKLRDMQAVTALHIDDTERQLAARQQAVMKQHQQLQQQQALFSAPSHATLSQQSQRGPGGSDGVPAGGLQELAAVLGVGSTSSGGSR